MWSSRENAGCSNACVGILSLNHEFFPVFGRGFADGRAEDAVEIGDVGKSAVVADGQDFVAGAAQLLHGDGQAALLEVATDA